MPLSLEAKIEAILFVSSKPLTTKSLAEICEVKVAEVEKTSEALREKYSTENSALSIIDNGKTISLATKPEIAGLVSALTTTEYFGELTRPQIETLAIIAYRQPVAKSELELLRGINCSLILRNLSLRDLVEEEKGAKPGEIYYRLSLEAMKYLGLKEVSDLPDYIELSSPEVINRILQNLAQTN